MIKNLLLFTLLITSFGLSSQDAISILQAREVDQEGSLIRVNQMVELTGLAIGPNFRGGGHTWVLYDVLEDIGITVFAFNNDVGYEVTDGDELRIVGELAEFNGLAELIPSEINIISQGNPLPEAQVVSMLSEQTEAKLITLNDVMLVDITQWGSGSFNVELTDGVNTFEARIDSDIDISGMPAPQGTFNITGIGGQFDSEAPFINGYQIFPRSVSDIDPYNIGAGPTYDAISLPQAREVDNDFALTRLGDRVEVSGVVHGINFRPSGLQFTVIDQNNVGLGVFSSDNLGYEFAEGDDITIFGSLSQFNGLAQINPDSIVQNSSGNDLVIPRVVSILDESTESSLVQVLLAELDETAWLGDGSSWNIEGMTTEGTTVTIRIDNDTELSTSPFPGQGISIIGVGGQFDNSAPFDEGYQLIPRTLEDISFILSNENIFSGDIKLFPNPTSGMITIDASEKISYVEVFNTIGQLIHVDNDFNNYLDLSNIKETLVYVKVHFSDSVYMKKINIIK